MPTFFSVFMKKFGFKIVFLNLNPLSKHHIKKSRYLNRQHKNIRFTSEIENVSISIPKSCKYDLLFTLLHRPFKLCSNFELFHQKFDKLKTSFENNGYPKSFVDFCIKKHLDKVFIKKEVVLTASKKGTYLCPSFYLK